MIAINRLHSAPRAAEIPTPEQIAEMTAQIRSKWSERTHRVRAGLSPEGLTLPTVSLDEDRAGEGPWFSSIA
ncbi:MAG: hypothetical protein HY000_32210 [Planctomycetes bacterium]|nr:hypothetical protein [Planctomycetota bacterium]